MRAIILLLILTCLITSTISGSLFASKVQLSSLSIEAFQQEIEQLSIEEIHTEIDILNHESSIQKRLVNEASKAERDAEKVKGIGKRWIVWYKVAIENHKRQQDKFIDLGIKHKLLNDRLNRLKIVQIADRKARNCDVFSGIKNA